VRIDIDCPLQLLDRSVVPPGVCTGPHLSEEIVAV
jgi:hypothetical protein